MYVYPRSFSPAFRFFISTANRRISTAAKMAAKRQVPGWFSQMAFRPAGRSRRIRMTGKIYAVETEIMAAGTGRSTASI